MCQIGRILTESNVTHNHNYLLHVIIKTIAKEVQPDKIDVGVHKGHIMDIRCAEVMCQYCIMKMIY